MHELALSDAVVEIVCKHANGRRVTTVELKIGHLRQVNPTALTFGFELLTKDTVAEGAELVCTLVPAQITCRRCRSSTQANSFPFSCVSCDSFDVELVSGEEFHVESIEVVDEAPLPAATR
jgi:hydrogenase nickel incorporation protein HypA/HybF